MKTYLDIMIRNHFTVADSSSVLDSGVAVRDLQVSDSIHRFFDRVRGDISPAKTAETLKQFEINCREAERKYREKFLTIFQ